MYREFASVTPHKLLAPSLPAFPSRSNSFPFCFLAPSWRESRATCRHKSFRIRSYKNSACNPFRIRSYKNTGGYVHPLHRGTKMKPHPVTSNSAPESPRCRHRTQNGRCRMPAVDSSRTLCFDHARQALQARETVDLLEPLTEQASRFQNAQGINYSLGALYSLLAQGRISPRRASVLAYISSLLLRTLPAIDNDPYPNAGHEAAEPSDLEGSGESLDSSADEADDTAPASGPAPASSSPSTQRQPLPDTVEGFLAAGRNRRDTS